MVGFMKGQRAHMKYARRLRTAIPAAMLGITLATAAAACQPTDGGGKSDAEVCADLDQQLFPLVADISTLGIDLSLDGPIDQMTADRQAQILNHAHTAFSNLSAALRAEADQADSADTAASLNTTADGVDADAAKIKTVRDVATVSFQTLRLDGLYQRCPELQTQFETGRYNG